MFVPTVSLLYPSPALVFPSLWSLTINSNTYRSPAMLRSMVLLRCGLARQEMARGLGVGQPCPSNWPLQEGALSPGLPLGAH